ncbi:PepSY domain-containing protein [Azospirillum sp. ST 5-10]|uniref:PepSY domain-containing protein n=1 Tax=unclassified Azospirillum TaxID=2630922 RepID=UPI003F4A1B97
MRTRFHALALAAAILLPAGTAAVAQQPAATAPAASPAAGPAAAPAADVGLAKAIEAARGAFDGRVIEAEREMRDGRFVYEIDLVKGGDVHRAIVDAQSGTVGSVDKRMLASTWRGWFGDDHRAAVESLSTDLGARLAEVERQTGGRAHELSLEEEGGRLFYEVEVITPTGDRDVLVDAASGEILMGELDD